MKCYYAELQSCFSLILAQVEWRALHNLIIKGTLITINNETMNIITVNTMPTASGIESNTNEEMSASS